ncbi:MAG: S1 family peptidase [Gemmatimonadetes bacterium]|nr:S1 family peptidase [Gemmatimonadota bacterium]
MRLRIRASGLVLIAGVTMFACSDAPEPLAVDTPDVQIAPQFSFQAIQDPLDALADALPGFGGLFLANDGTATVYLMDPDQRETAAPIIAAFLEQQDESVAGLRVLQAQHDYRTLRRWFAEASARVLGMPGAVFVDLDESANRLRIGVEQTVVASQIQSAVANLGIPLGAIDVVQTDPIVAAVTLRDFIRPSRGGHQINFGNFLCTLGFNATHAAGASFITNSHCTNVQGGTEGTLYYQPLSTVAGSFIGTEAADPVYFMGGVCPAGRRCRYSDAARVAYTGGASFVLGRIQRTTGLGSITIMGVYKIVKERLASPLLGQVVNKVGRTTGWTQGSVAGTCVNTNVANTNITQLCQAFVNAGVGGGDSGSNVFRIKTGNEVVLFGILWGGNFAGTQFVYSPLGQVESELGALTTF